jgi:hypothetical protein
LDGIEHHAVKSDFSVIEEGENSGFFFPEEAAQAKKAAEDAEKNKFTNPRKKWKNNKAKKICMIVYGMAQ